MGPFQDTPMFLRPSDEHSVCGSGDDMDEDARWHLDGVLSGLAGSSTRRQVLFDAGVGGISASDDQLDDGDDDSAADNLDDFDDDDSDDDDSDDDDGFFVNDDHDDEMGCFNDDGGFCDGSLDDGRGVYDDGGRGGESNDDDSSDSGGGDSDDGTNGNNDVGWSGEGNGDRSHHCLHSNYDDRYRYFYGLLRGAALSEPMVREDVALRAVTAGSAVEFSPEEMEQHLQRCVDELRIMRSRGNVYFV